MAMRPITLQAIQIPPSPKPPNLSVRATARQFEVLIGKEKVPMRLWVGSSVDGVQFTALVLAVLPGDLEGSLGKGFRYRFRSGD